MNSADERQGAPAPAPAPRAIKPHAMTRGEQFAAAKIAAALNQLSIAEAACEGAGCDGQVVVESFDVARRALEFAIRVVEGTI